MKTSMKNSIMILKKMSSYLCRMEHLLTGYWKLSWLNPTIPNWYMDDRGSRDGERPARSLSLIPYDFFLRGFYNFFVFPSLNPMCFFLRGFFKYLAYNSTVANFEDLNTSTKDGFSLVTPVMWPDVVQSSRKRLLPFLKCGDTWVEVCVC